MIEAGDIFVFDDEEVFLTLEVVGRWEHSVYVKTLVLFSEWGSNASGRVEGHHIFLSDGLWERIAWRS